MKTIFLWVLGGFFIILALASGVHSIFATTSPPYPPDWSSPTTLPWLSVDPFAPSGGQTQIPGQRTPWLASADVYPSSTWSCVDGNNFIIPYCNLYGTNVITDGPFINANQQVENEDWVHFYTWKDGSAAAAQIQVYGPNNPTDALSAAWVNCSVPFNGPKLSPTQPNYVCPSEFNTLTGVKPTVNPPAPATISKVQLSCQIFKAEAIGEGSIPCTAAVYGVYGVYTYPGNMNSNVTWTVTDGSITNVSTTQNSNSDIAENYATYVQPASISGPQSNTVARSEEITVTATSKGDPTKSASTTFALFQPPQLAAATLPASTNSAVSCSALPSGNKAFSAIGPVPSNYRTMRYINIAETSGFQWAAYNEIQVYDANGNPITISPSNIWVSSQWLGAEQSFPLVPGASYPSYWGNSLPDGIGAAGLVDGNLSTGWNAGYGYSAPGPLVMPDDFYQMTGMADIHLYSPAVQASINNCNANHECPYGGMVTIDLGSPQAVSRISVLAVNPDLTKTIFTISGSTDGTTFTPVGILDSQFVNMGIGNDQWIDLALAPGLFNIRSQTNSYPTALSSCTATGSSVFTPTTFTMPNFAALLAAMATPPTGPQPVPSPTSTSPVPPQTFPVPPSGTNSFSSAGTSVLNEILNPSYLSFSQILGNINAQVGASAAGSAAGQAGSSGSCVSTAATTISSSLQTLQSVSTLLASSNVSPAIVSSVQNLVSAVAQVLTSLEKCIAS